MPGNLGGLAAAQMISGIAASTTVVMRALRKCNELTMFANKWLCNITWPPWRPRWRRSRTNSAMRAGDAPDAAMVCSRCRNRPWHSKVQQMEPEVLKHLAWLWM